MTTPHVPWTVGDAPSALALADELPRGRLTLGFRPELPLLTDVVVDLGIPWAGRVAELAATLALAGPSWSTYAVYGAPPDVIAALRSVPAPGSRAVEPVPASGMHRGQALRDEEDPSLETFVGSIVETARPSPAPLRQSAPPPPAPRLAPVGLTGRAAPAPDGGAAIPAASSDAGDFGEKGWRTLLLERARSRDTGVLVIDGLHERRWAYFVDGLPVRFLRQPPARSEGLVHVAVTMGLVPAAVAERTEELARLAGEPEGQALVRLAGLSAPDLDRVRREAATRITRYLLGSNFGRYAFYPVPEVARLLPDTPASVGAALLDAARSRWAAMDEDRLGREKDARLELRWLPRPGSEALLAQLPLPMPERRFTDRYLPAGFRVRELLQRRDLADRQAVELMLSLADLGISEFTDSEGDMRDKLRLNRALLRCSDGLKSRDHFQFLGVHWSSLGDEVEAAVARLDSALASGRAAAELGAEQREVLELARARLAEVRATLISADGRRKHRNERIGADQREMAADLFAKQGDMALFKGDARLAGRCFQRALELDPGTADGEERRARARAALVTLGDAG
ncbi:hypothetical protein L6R50_06080 [Myxococcota bacterium]|nr:hypothetical protein [Myxococcota bacterium]